ncbi:hypothetical protein M3_0137 [Lysinibacillus phage vB_LfM_LysYB1]|nr:hypothetical protein M3_0137 [Lysinibacillus phage vB_LfM_LysYB1]WAB25352.1 hypothetical protein M5_0174 [Lysinibacillus phage vB_LfM_LysYB2]
MSECQHKKGKVVEIESAFGHPDRITMECECGVLVVFQGLQMTGVEERYHSNDVSVTETLLNMKGGE